MVTVSEDYVSHKTAKLLEGKFNSEDCFAFYKENGDIGFLQTFGDIAEYDPETCVHAPTLQMAMKVLREEKDVLITYDLAGPIGSKLLVKVYRKDYDLDWIEATTIIRKTLEEAIDTAIQWSLENLI